jgi:hypothetical protein
MPVELVQPVIGITFLAVWALAAGIVVQARRES